MRGRCLGAALVVAAMSIACGDSSSLNAPTPSQSQFPQGPAALAQIAGAWAGSLELTFKGARGAVPTRADLQQTGQAISGAWQMTDDANDTRGAIQGTLQLIGSESRFTGTVTWQTEPETGTGKCAGTSTFTGTASGTRLSWTSNLVAWQNCTDPPTQLVWTMQR